MPKLTEKAIRYRRTDGRTDPNYRKASLLKRKREENLFLRKRYFFLGAIFIWMVEFLTMLRKYQKFQGPLNICRT